jgi:hypothetical protein
MVTPKAWLRMVTLFSPDRIVYRTQPAGGPQGMGVLVGMDGT